MSLASQLAAFFGRDLRIDLSYRLSFMLGLVDIALGAGAFYFLARVLGKSTLDGYQSFPFILIGIAVNGYMTTCLSCFSSGVRGNYSAGALKGILLTPLSPSKFIIMSSVYPYTRAAVDLVLYLLAGALLGVTLSGANLPAAVLLFVLSVMGWTCIGIASACFTLVFKRGDPLVWLVGALSWLLGGVFYPVDVLPRFLQRAALLLPITHTLEAMRAVLLRGARLGDIGPQLMFLGLFAMAGLPLSLMAFNIAVRHAKTTGTLGHF